MEGYNCFGCSPNNPIGAHMRFYDYDPEEIYDYVVSVWNPANNFQSWLETLHGGMQATLLDEVCGWVVFEKLKASAVTAKIDIRFIKKISTTGGPLVIRAALQSFKHRIAKVEGQIWAHFDTPRQPDKLDMLLPYDQIALREPALASYQLCALCNCTYFTFNEEKSKEMGYRAPALGSEDITLEQLVEQAKADASRVNYRKIM